MTTLKAPTETEYQQMAAATGRLLARLRFDDNPIEHDAGHWALGELGRAGALLKMQEAEQNDNRWLYL